MGRSCYYWVIKAETLLPLEWVRFFKRGSIFANTEQVGLIVQRVLSSGVLEPSRISSQHALQQCTAFMFVSPVFIFIFPATTLVRIHSVVVMQTKNDRYQPARIILFPPYASISSSSAARICSDGVQSSIARGDFLGSISKRGQFRNLGVIKFVEYTSGLP